MISYSAASALVKELYDAVKAGDVGLAQDLLARGVSPNVFDSQGRTPLIIAAGADPVDPLESEAATDRERILGQPRVVRAKGRSGVVLAIVGVALALLDG